jgi:hypothetical protein
MKPLGSGLPYIETTTEEKSFSLALAMEVNIVMLQSFDFVSRLTMPQVGEQRFVEYEVVSWSTEVFRVIICLELRVI